MANYDELKALITQRIAALDNATGFNLRDLLGSDWPLDKTANVVGKAFRSDLNSFPGIRDEGTDSANLRWYYKI